VAKYPLTALGGDIFAGLFTVGVKQAGYKVLGHLEHSNYGVATAQLNHPELVGRVWMYPSDWPEPKTFGKVNLMFCNPPCAAWSSARASKKGSWQEHTERLGYIDNLATYGIDLRPDAWAWESVTNAWRHGRGFIDRIAQAWMAAGYHVTVIKQNNMYLGTPQNRPRILVVAHRYPLIYPDLTAPITVRQALKGLRISKGEKIEAEVTATGWDKLWELSENHGKMRRSWQALDTKEVTALKVSRRPGFFSRRLLPDQPAPVNLDRVNLLHPFEPRMLTWSEQLRLCGLPPDWRGAGGGNGSDFIMLSRAVMPPVGKWLATAVAAGITTGKRLPRRPVYTLYDCSGGPDKVFAEEQLAAPDSQFGDVRQWSQEPAPAARVRIRSPRAPGNPVSKKSGLQKMGSGEFIRECLERGDHPDKILAEVHRQFPNSKATLSDVAWQRNRLRKQKESQS